MIPKHLQDRYEQLQQQWRDLVSEAHNYKPTYYSVARYAEKHAIDLSHDDQQKLAAKARHLSMLKAMPIKSKPTALGVLYCFHEEVLDQLTTKEE